MPDPTPTEIKAQCLEIQKTWSPEERRKRRYNPTYVNPIQYISSYDIFGHRKLGGIIGDNLHNGKIQN